MESKRWLKNERRMTALNRAMKLWVREERNGDRRGEKWRESERGREI